MLYFLIGIAVAFNIIVIKIKLQKARYLDGILDLVILVIITIVFSGSFGALVTGTIASAVFSIYLYFSPPKFQLHR